MFNLIQRNKKLKNRKGFTLIELIVVIAILGILAAVLVPQLGGFTAKAEQAQVLTDASAVATAADALYLEKKTVPDKDEIISLAGVTGTITGATTEEPELVNVGDDDTPIYVITFTYKVNDYSVKRSATDGGGLDSVKVELVD